MEFGDVGGYCDLCGRQDYLPTECCGKTFCEQCYRSRHQPACPLNRTAGGAKLQQDQVEQRPSQGDHDDTSPNSLKSDDLYCSDDHTSAGTKNERASKMNSMPQASEQLACVACRVKLVPEKSVRCELCDQITCFKHRFEDDHPCFEFFGELESRFGQRKSAQQISKEQWELVLRIVSNVIKKQDNKYRFLKRANETVRAQVFSSIPLMRIFAVLGFEADVAGLTLPTARIPRVARVWQQNKNKLTEFQDKIEEILLLASSCKKKTDHEGPLAHVPVVPTSSREPPSPFSISATPAPAPAAATKSASSTASAAAPPSAIFGSAPAAASSASSSRPSSLAAPAPPLTASTAFSAPASRTTSTLDSTAGPSNRRASERETRTTAGARPPEVSTSTHAVSRPKAKPPENDALAELRELRKQKYREKNQGQGGGVATNSGGTASAEDEGNCVLM